MPAIVLEPHLILGNSAASLTELEHLVGPLEMFRFCTNGGGGGWVDPMDWLELRLAVGVGQSVLEMCVALGIPLQCANRHAAPPAREVHSSLVDGHKGYAQPGQVRIAGRSCFVEAHPPRPLDPLSYDTWTREGRERHSQLRPTIVIHVTGPGRPAVVTRADVDCAVQIKALVNAIPEVNIVEPPIDSEFCFCPKYYPVSFRSGRV